MFLSKLYYSLFIIIFSLTSNVFAKPVCDKNAVVEYFEKNKKKIFQKEFCYDQKNDLIINKECSEKKDCLAMKERAFPLRLKNTTTQYGNSNFKTCHFFKANPMLITLKTANKKIESSICIFEDDSFVSLSYMNQYLLRYF